MGIYNLFQHSAVRYNKPKKLKSLLNQKVQRFKKSTQVRWLSTHEAVEAICSAWTLFILSLEREATSSNNNGQWKQGVWQKRKIFCFYCNYLLPSWCTWCCQWMQQSLSEGHDWHWSKVINAKTNKKILVSIWKNCFPT